MRGLIGAVWLLALALGASEAAAQDKKEPPKFDAKKLVGKWEPVDSKIPVTIEFTDKGKLILSVEFGGKSDKVEGDYKLSDDKLDLVLRAEGKEQKETLTLSKLTDEELVAKDSRGKEETLKRQKPKK
jgi:uncharacterized protein (TIGR03066 family)